MTEPIDASREAGDVTEPSEDDLHHPLTVRKAATLTAILGIIHAILVIVALLLIKTRAPDVRASDAALVAFYSDPDQRRIFVIAGLYLIPFAAIAFIWFLVALRAWVRFSARRENVLLSNVQFVSGIIYTTLLMAAGAALTVLAVSVELSGGSIDPLFARQFPQFGTSLILVFAMRMAAMFVLTSANITRSARILPRWFALLSVGVAAGLLLTASLSPWLILVFPAWILVFCAILLVRIRRIPGEQLLPDRIERVLPGSRLDSLRRKTPRIVV